MVKITFRRITAKQFSQYFALDSPGYFLAKEAEAAGEIGSPREAVEVLCLANQLYQTELDTRLMVELQPLGKLDEYLDTRDAGEGSTFLVATLGKERMKRILREIAQEVRAAMCIGQNDKKAAPKRRRQ